MVFKPLHGYFTQHWLCFSPRQFELLFCVPDDQDPAITLVQRLQEKYPNVDTQLFIGKSHSVTACEVENSTDRDSICITKWFTQCSWYDFVGEKFQLIFGRGIERIIKGTF